MPNKQINSDATGHQSLQLLSLFVLAILLYANTFNHEYALDDSIVIIDNRLTQKGFDGISEIMTNDAFYGFFGEERNLVAGGRYRPLSIVTFAIEYEFFGLNPTISHVINVLMYGLLCMLIFSLSNLLLRDSFNNQLFFSVPYLIALLFLAHPIHTEVVANIKGRDEIMGMLGAAGALFLLIKYLDKGNNLYLAGSFLLFFLGLLSKENAITYLAVFPLAVYFFRSNQLKKSIPGLVGYLILAGAYLFLRQKFTSGDFTESTTVLNNAYILASNSEKFATILFTVAKYFQLLIFPHPLTHDYYFNQIPYKSFADPVVLLTIVSLIFLAWHSLKGLIKKDLIAFGILYFFITFSIVSNVFFNVGTAMSERLIFLSSYGFVLILPVLIHRIAKRLYKSSHIYQIRLIAVSVFALGFAIKTVERNSAWADNYTLFSTDIHYSPNSAKLNNALGGTLIEKSDEARNEQEKQQLLNDAIFYLKRAVEIYPEYSTAWNLLGNAHFKRGDDLAVIRPFYEKALEVAPGMFEANMNFGIVLNINKEHEEAFRYLNRAANMRPHTYEVWYHIGDGFFHLQRPDRAVEALTRAVQVRSDGHEAHYKLGLVYGRQMSEFNLAIHHFEQAIIVQPNRYFYHEDLGVAHGFIGNHQEAIRAFERVIELRPNYAQAYRNLAASYFAMGDKETAEKYGQRFRELSQ